MALEAPLSQFTDQLAAVIADSASMHLSDILQAAPGWMAPGLEWSGDVLDISGMNDAFSRKDIGQATETCLLVSPYGSSGEAASLKVQNDYVAAVERAFRTRHATRLRCHFHASARRRGHGNKLGPIAAVGDMVNELLARGKNTE